MNSADWKCPVCGFYAANGDEQDKHIKETGHVAQETTQDAGVSHPHADTSDMSYSEQSGYAPGATNQTDSHQTTSQPNEQNATIPQIGSIEDDDRQT